MAERRDDGRAHRSERLEVLELQGPPCQHAVHESVGAPSPSCTSSSAPPRLTTAPAYRGGQSNVSMAATGKFGGVEHRLRSSRLVAGAIAERLVERRLRGLPDAVAVGADAAEQGRGRVRVAGTDERDDAVLQCDDGVGVESVPGRRGDGVDEVDVRRAEDLAVLLLPLRVTTPEATPTGTPGSSSGSPAHRTPTPRQPAVEADHPARPSRADRATPASTSKRSSRREPDGEASHIPSSGRPSRRPRRARCRACPESSFGSGRTGDRPRSVLGASRAPRQRGRQLVREDACEPLFVALGVQPRSTTSSR